MNRELYGFNAKKATEDLVSWMEEWFDKNGNGCHAIVGISGGKDSTVTAALCAKVLGPDNVYGVLLPDGIQGDIDDSYAVVEMLGIQSMVLNIEDTCDTVRLALRHGMRFAYMSEQARVNLPPRIRMVYLFAVAQSINGRVVGTCNLSEDYVGYSTYGGDAFASVMPLACLTSDEVIAVGYELGLPPELLEKTPSDGLCGKSDEDNLGFTYAALNKYIRTGVCEDVEVKEKIDRLHKQNLFKLRMPDSFPYLTDEEKSIAKRLV